MSVVAVIQARMTSSRLPGKVLMPILGKPLLAYQLERLRRCKNIDKIVLATTTNTEDDPVAELAKHEKIDIFRGSEHDVLDRMYHAATAAKATTFVRLTGDCPLIDPLLIDTMVTLLDNPQIDYAHTAQSFAEGLSCEVCSMKLLEEAWNKAELASEREHVTLYIRNRPEKYSLFSYNNERDDSGYRITVDEPEDFEVVKLIIEALYPKTSDFTFTEIRNFLLEHPEIVRMNSKIIRNEGLIKSLTNDKIYKD
ncbi:MAG: cytidylyltransferase domain-containing protein [Desulfovibrio sp.]